MKLTLNEIVDAGSLRLSSCCYSPDGKYIAAGGGMMGAPGGVVICPASAPRTWSETYTLSSSIATTLAWHPGSRQLAATGQSTDSIELLDRDDAKASRKVLFLREPYYRTSAGILIESTHVADMDYSPNAALLAIACWDTTAKLVDPGSDSITTLRIPRNPNNVELARFSNDGSLIFVGTAEQLAIWDCQQAELSHTISLPADGNWKHTLISDIQCVLSVATNGDVLIHNRDLAQIESTRLTFADAANPTCLSYSPRMHCAAVGLSDGTAVICDLDRVTDLGRVRIGKSPVKSLAFSPWIRQLAAIVDDAAFQMAIYDIKP